MTTDKKIIKWFVFGGVSTFLAFILPAYLWAKANSYLLNIPGSLLLEFLIMDIFLVLSLWHGKYRADTLINDFSRSKKGYLKLVNTLFFIAMLMLIISNFIIISQSSKYL
jgi:hypothetical protein